MGQPVQLGLLMAQTLICFFHLLSLAHRFSGRSLEFLGLTLCPTLCVALCVYWQTLEHQGYTGLVKDCRANTDPSLSRSLCTMYTKLSLHLRHPSCEPYT